MGEQEFEGIVGIVSIYGLSPCFHDTLNLDCDQLPPLDERRVKRELERNTAVEMSLMIEVVVD